MNDLIRAYSANLNQFDKRSDSELSILLYHGVTSCNSKGIENYYKKHIGVDDFRSQMEYVSKYCNVISVDDYLDVKNSDNLFPKKSVIITFDDGFFNNYTNAAPLLDELNIPATFYVSSGVVNTDIMFWVDSIEDCVNLSCVNKVIIRLDRVSEFSIVSEEQKLFALSEIKKYCKKENRSNKDRVLRELIEQTGVEPSVHHSANYQKISWPQLRQMASNKLFTIGGHSLYHDILTSLGDRELDVDICTSIGLLESNLPIEVKHYSYPEGQENHYNNAVISVLKKYGIKCSPTAIMGMNKVQTDPFELRRIMVGFMGVPFPFNDASL